jgi:hypothetical protein
MKSWATLLSTHQCSASDCLPNTFYFSPGGGSDSVPAAAETVYFNKAIHFLDQPNRQFFSNKFVATKVASWNFK